MRPALLLIFAKPPRIGVSKTRLARGLGAAEARRIAAFTLARTLNAARASRLPTRVCAAPDAVVRERGAARLFGGFALCPQGPGGLTQRLTRAFNAAPFGPVLFIGADAPDITPARLRAAAAHLRCHDAVFGPARDGGFWLFGMHKGLRMRAPFSDVRWSGPHAMEDVRSRLAAQSRVALLDVLIDIDEAGDWADWVRQKG